MIRIARTTEPLFDIGENGLVATPGALEALQARGVAPRDLVDRHLYGDYGEVPEEVRDLNDAQVKNGGRILSHDRIGEDRAEIWVITDAVGDNGRRSHTTILLPSEY